VFRILSLTRLSTPDGRGVTNQAVLFHKRAGLRVAGLARQVDNTPLIGVRHITLDKYLDVQTGMAQVLGLGDASGWGA